MSQRIVYLALAGLIALSSSAVGAEKRANSRPRGVQISQQEGKLRLEINGEFFAEYHYQDVSRPFLYPVMAAGGLPVTRNWPMKEVENEERDHPHQRSLWYAHGDINGHDFWSESNHAGKTVHEKFLKVKSGSKEGLILSRNKLVAKDGTIIATDERTIRIYNRDQERLFDVEVTIHASNGDLTFGDTKEGAMAIRLAETMRLKGKVANGHIVNSEGMRDGETWGKRAKWCDYYGPVNHQIVGVAIFDHPQNPRHPTWWHVRDYGLFAANPFGIHDFEKKPKGAGDLKLSSGKSITFRYRFYIHAGDENQAKVEQYYQQYAGGDSR